MNFIKSYILLFCMISFIGFSQQKQLQVNSTTIDYNTCYDIKIVKQIPEILPGFTCDIRDAQIIDDCLELTIAYGGCNGNLELMTDNSIDKNTHLNIKARWIEPSLCKALTIVKVLFDLKPYKKLVQDQSATLKIVGTNFELFYN